MDKLNANSDIEQRIIFMKNNSEKMEHLHRFMIENKKSKMLIFLRLKHKCRKMHDKMGKKGFETTWISGAKAQSARESAIRAFKRGDVKIMFATDVAGRGIHVDDIEYVIQYDMPDRGFEDYVHRIGRTGRAGKKGIAISYFVPQLDSHHARTLIRVLENCNQPVPEKLKGMRVTSDRRNGMGRRCHQ